MNYKRYDRLRIINMKNIIGLTICTALFLSGFVIHGHTGLYLNLSGFIIVVAGTIVATLLSYRFDRIIILYKVLKASYSKELMAPGELIRILVELAAKKRIKGILSLQRDEHETTIIFLRQAIGLLVDGNSASDIKEALNMEMRFFKFRREASHRVVKTMADIAPSFGLVGSVVGLISMLSGIGGESNVVLSAIPIALTSTLYGIVLANFFFLPFAVNIQERTIQELLLQNIITQGILAIADDVHPSALDRKLKSLQTPSERAREPITLIQLHKKLKRREEVLEHEKVHTAELLD